MVKTIYRLLCASVLLAACSVAWSDVLTVYSGRSEKFIRPLLEQFSTETGIEIEPVFGSSSILLSIMSLRDAGAGVDLYISNDVGNLQRGSDFNIFRPLSEPVMEGVPVTQRAPDNTWLGLSGRMRVLVVNTQSPLGSEIDSVFDLADPKFKGRVAITRGSNESFVSGAISYAHATSMARIKQWLNGLKNNAGQIFRKHSHVVNAVAKGEFDVGLVNYYYIYRHLRKNPDAPIRVVVPDQRDGEIGAAWNMAGIAVSKYTDKPELAERLVAFLASQDGQQVFADVNQEFPVRTGLLPSTAVRPLSESRIADVPMEVLSRKREDVVELISITGIPR